MSQPNKNIGKENRDRRIPHNHLCMMPILTVGFLTTPDAVFELGLCILMILKVG